MKIDIQAGRYRLTGWLLEHVVQRVRDFLAHGRDRIRNVTVRLIDLNGRNGGQDQRCVVQVKLDRLPKVVTEETQVDLRVAVDRALSRAGRAVTRRLERAREDSHAASPNFLQLRHGLAWQAHPPPGRGRTTLPDIPVPDAVRNMIMRNSDGILGFAHHAVDLRGGRQLPERPNVALSALGRLRVCEPTPCGSVSRHVAAFFLPVGPWP